ncbi:MAG: hypothetical protein JNJ83_19425 [Verrucomicrobiaceae bacterium]|nr:hypothetical protein [Verrucomicrobiaceae bacterium]
MHAISPVMLGTAALLLLSACDDGSASRVKSMRSEIDQLGKSVFEAQQTSRRLESQLEATKAERAKLEDTVKKAQQELDAAKAELEQLKKDFDNYKARYKVSLQERVPGLPLPDFQHRGTSYAQVTVVEMNAEMIGFRHAAGLGKLGLGELPELIRDVLALTQNHLPLVSEASGGDVGRKVSAKAERKSKIDTLLAEGRQLDLEREQLRKVTIQNANALREVLTQIERFRYANKEGGPPVTLNDQLQKLQREGAELKAQATALEVRRWDIEQRRRNVQ